ncbi:hypothetical protein HYZ78_04025 [Candidatus Microgenomates bacterium]|nr:hypothetical protein [Candidatus Microgenomates bacterium]
MSNFKFLINPFLIILIAIVLRLAPHEPNFAPITAMALFGGAYLNSRYALIVPLAAMFVSDIFIGFHSTMPFVYASFLLSGLIGLRLRNHKNVLNVVAASFGASVLFFLITNFGVWLVGGLYPHTGSGLVQCFINAIPFFRNTVLGDFFYTGLFFGGYELVLKMVGRKYASNT